MQNPSLESPKGKGIGHRVDQDAQTKIEKGEGVVRAWCLACAPAQNAMFLLEVGNGQPLPWALPMTYDPVDFLPVPQYFMALTLSPVGQKEVGYSVPLHRRFTRPRLFGTSNYEVYGR